MPITADIGIVLMRTFLPNHFEEGRGEMKYQNISRMFPERKEEEEEWGVGAKYLKMPLPPSPYTSTSVPMAPYLQRLSPFSSPAPPPPPPLYNSLGKEGCRKKIPFLKCDGDFS